MSDPYLTLLGSSWVVVQPNDPILNNMLVYAVEYSELLRVTARARNAAKAARNWLAYWRLCDDIQAITEVMRAQYEIRDARRSLPNAVRLMAA